MKKIEKIASLAKIHVEPREVEALEVALDALLDFFAQFQQLDTQGVDSFAAMTMSGDQSMPLRDDKVDPQAHVDVTGQTSFKDHGMFKVPRVLGAQS